MTIHAVLPPRERDYRLDLLRGFANWAIYLDHIPNNAVNWITQRNFGFSDAADLFVFISGYTASFVYARIMLERGFVIGGTRLVKRAWQIYVAHIVLFVIYIAEIGYLAARYHDPNLENEFNVAGFMRDPAETLYQGLILAFKPVNMDVLPLYILLMLCYPAVLWLMLRRPNLTLAASFLLYLAARHFGWNLAAYPVGSWYFNPFCWQFLFVFGGWFALGGAAESMALIRSRALLIVGGAYLVFALVMTMAGRFPEFGATMPSWLVDAFNPNDKTNLAPYRLVHFIILAFFITRFMPRDWPGLRWPVFAPMIKCGQQSLEVFCVGVFLAVVAHIILVEVSDTVWMQIVVSIGGIVLLTLLAYYRSWSKRVDKRPPKPVAGTAPLP
ncbi:OpgC domain-containing protein [Bradyrhizobium sp. U87765 SZCCT0131]|uniref:OpgC domain-containing protein n=1 Tax=unclassified Bradyrhizobium TaxID=2631580 RepID=UPI001BA9C8A0|nr:MULTISPECIES: OpgC domain-containing protein [unclassified Bradyrhizobium]MBR1221664.1 OpgC domain-containing protein [Bradyrhizobium sp. U87765 SZCCT0131]MBR1264413.1 OpgC domain-containing protein [Bradyrhizobium sp. U87765 SZCCT0134]MBR1304680.1 OpgC domain-containing protein [Bradyrhizobium sp. U87765 SZCCT0110]MBR1322463.1 OpgC domain-containing protein [Bradyrhizobium sp. U87765 SZCCT0109]MBR1346609.1 OpgC domain-containing protein [Bradyrhizobium sp. U87765 SZCCT0048]